MPEDAIVVSIPTVFAPLTRFTAYRLKNAA
jgi:hypothetical protein